MDAVRQYLHTEFDVSMDMLVDVTQENIKVYKDPKCVIQIGSHSYDGNEFLDVLNGNALALVESDKHLYVIYAKDEEFDALALPQLKIDTCEGEPYTFKFNPKTHEKVVLPMTQTFTSKVVGTTFHPLPEDKKVSVLTTARENDIPTATCQAILQPEPTNQFDPDAVQVVVRLTDGAPFVIGYLPKDNPQKALIKAPRLAEVTIVGYETVGLSNSYTVTFK